MCIDSDACIFPYAVLPNYFRKNKKPESSSLDIDICYPHFPSQVEGAPGLGDPDTKVNSLAGYACEKVWSNAATDEENELLTLRITKV